MFDPYNYKWAGRRHICPKYPTTSGRRVGRALLQLSLHKNLSWESLMWVKWAHWSVRRLLCRCICSKSSSIQHQRQWSCQSWVPAMRVGALYQFPHASLSFFQLPLFYILVEIIDSSIKDYSIWQVLWDPIINRVKNTSRVDWPSEHSFHMPLLFFCLDGVHLGMLRHMAQVYASNPFFHGKSQCTHYWISTDNI